MNYENFSFLENEIINDWKKINQIQNLNLNMINCEINYYNLNELKEIKKNINNISVIKNYNIKSISNKKIEYDIFFYGNFKILGNLFNLHKLKINYTSNICKISLI